MPSRHARPLPQAPGAHLPIDMPPRPSRLPATVLKGLFYESDFGTMTTPVPRPWTPFQSEVFPLVHPSAVGPAFIAPKYGVAINDYSPVPHRRGGELMSTVLPVPTIRPVRILNARSTTDGMPGRRSRGVVYPQPPVNPTWASAFGGRTE